MDRFGMLEVDNGKPNGTIKPPAPATAQLPEHLQHTETNTSKTHGDIDQAARTRAVAAAIVADKHGLVPSEATFFSLGTRGQWGDKAARKRAELHDRLIAPELLAAIDRTVKAEDRRGTVVALKELSYSDKDLLGRAGKPGVRLTEHAFGQLLGRAGAPAYAGGYLGQPEVPSALRAPHVNHWLAGAHNGTDAIRAQCLTKLLSDGERIGYGVVSEKYTRYDLDAVARDVIASVPNTSRGALVYNPESTRWRLDLSIGAEFEPTVGDIHRVTLRVKGSDAGAGSIVVSLFAERVRCLNFSQIRLNGALDRVRHVGDVRARVKGLLDLKGAALTDFADVYREANEEAIVAEALRSDGDAQTVFKALIKGGYVDAPQGADIAVERFFTAWLEEPGHTRAAFVNAITRAAHTAAWSSPWVTEALEEQASSLLYNRVVLTTKEVEAVA